VNTLAQDTTAGLSARRAAKPIRIETNWRGLNFILNEKVTQDLIAGITGSVLVAGFVATALGASSSRNHWRCCYNNWSKDSCYFCC